ncbi:MFS transporter [Nocardioides sp. BP30]|uniref:MFS transporter n=1 Tax=Nocardioides sp. BP30 TaxID=3036374 RepID=UPI00246838EF|nr:MFS transporter [Nocardioides sp. BP30]WGL52237.1 MFS transporter [Nocardioides sp. BP30]
MTSTVLPRAHKAPLPSDLPPNAGRAAAGIFIVLIAQLMLVLDATVVNVALPHISTDLSFSPAGLSWVLNGYTLAFGGLLLLGGRLGDVFGRLRVFWLGLAVFTLFSLVGGLAQSAEMLVVSRALQGVGAAIAAPSVLALLTTSAPDEAARNRALGLFTAVSSGGGALGLILGGILTDLISWRWTLFINVPIGLFVLLTVRRFVTETPRRPGRFDIVGAIAATGGAVSVVWGLIGAPDHGWGSVRTIGALALGVVLIAILAVTERRVAHPLLRPSLLRSHRRVASLAIMATFYGGMMAMFFLMVQFLEDDLGFSPLTTGLAFLPMPASIFTLSRITPRLVARFGQLPLILVGTTGMTLGFLRLAELGSGAGYVDVFPSLLTLGISAGLTFMPITSLVLLGVEPEHAGSASGLLQTMQQLGGSVGLAVIASVYAANAVPGDFLHGARYGFGASAILAGLALVSALTLAARLIPRRSPRVALD